MYKGKFELFGLACIWMEIYFSFSDLHKVFAETSSEDVDLSKTQPCKLKTQS